jgi:hypothetical protein
MGSSSSKSKSQAISVPPAAAAAAAAAAETEEAPPDLDFDASSDPNFAVSPAISGVSVARQEHEPSAGTSASVAALRRLEEENDEAPGRVAFGAIQVTVHSFPPRIG